MRPHTPASSGERPPFDPLSDTPRPVRPPAFFPEDDVFARMIDRTPKRKPIARWAPVLLGSLAAVALVAAAGVVLRGAPPTPPTPPPPPAPPRPTTRRRAPGPPSGAGGPAAGAAAARAAGGRLHTLTDRAALAEAAELLGGSDRARFLTPRLHQEMFEELRGPGEDLRDGIDLRSMELAPDEHAKLRIAARSDVMDRLREWSGGRALGELTRDRVLSSSALVAVTLPCEGGRDAASLSDYARAGAALERVWLEAGRRGLAVQPVSPVFLYAHRAEELTAISEDFADTLTSLQGRFLDLLGVPGHEIMALVLRLSYAAAATVRSRRLPAPGAGQGS